ncbi:hypothetical protein PENANT_c004G11763 [Penicillium antarcticum]|uniref:Ysc84 actin-binding domain-containing protein n=1 Tax=Penicillium antarcticum TaxID=416450 RepID=A0A1V6QGQ2_9EURO|nr:hypothetical protein PENANT_c004G11763 [Penicillium antarcticum]
MARECKKAAAILESFINPKLKIDGEIPRKVFKGAKGIAIFTALRAGFLGSARFGSGLIVARLPDGSWSAPSAIGMGGVGAGGQFGMELTDFVFVLTTDSAVKTFMQAGSLTLGGNISMAFGPIGRSAEAGGILGAKGGAGVFAYSKTRGLYGGVTVEGGFIAERPHANKKFYGRKMRAVELLTGLVPLPAEAAVLMDVLNGEFFIAERAGEASAQDHEHLDPQTTGTIAGDSGEQPQSGSAPAAGQAPGTEPVAEQAPQLPELSNFENLDMAQKPNVQDPNSVVARGLVAEQGAQQETQTMQLSKDAQEPLSVVDQDLEVREDGAKNVQPTQFLKDAQEPLPVVDQASAAEQDAEQDVQLTQSSSNAHDYTKEETERPASSVQQDLSEEMVRKEAKGKEPEVIKPEERPSGPNIEHAH